MARFITRYSAGMRRTIRSIACLIAATVVSALTTGAGAQQPASPAAAATPELPGSTRNSRIARAMPADPAERQKVQLSFLASGLTAEQVTELNTVAPNVRIVVVSGRDAAMEHAAAVDAVDARLVTAEFVAKATRLCWVHSPSAGVERLLVVPGIRERKDLVITNARGVHGPAIADHAMAMLLSLTRQLPHYQELQARREWSREEPPQRPVALARKTMLIVGIGGIGTEIAARAHGFGMKVIATRRSDTPSPDFVEHVGKPDELAALLPRADVIAVCVPLTPETEHLFNDKMLHAVKPGAYLINIARGKIIDTDAMIAALKDGRLAGAALDVTDPEPLPSGHPLWTAPNVLITPHVAAEGQLTDERWWALYKENIRRFGAGQPLLNCVDAAAGY